VLTENEKACAVRGNSDGPKANPQHSINADQAAHRKCPTRNQIVDASAVRIQPIGSRTQNRYADTIFPRLQNTEALGNRKLTDKQRYFRRLYFARYRAHFLSGVIYTELHLSKTSQAQRRVLDACVELGWLIPYEATNDKCTRFLVTNQFPLVPLRRRERNRDCVVVRTRREKVKKGRFMKEIGPKKMQFDHNDPVALETTELLAVVNKVSRLHDFGAYYWNPFERDFDGSVRLYDTHLTAKFSFNKDNGAYFEQNGRLHTEGADGYQAIRKIERRTFFIEDLPCYELDYKCLHPRMAYNLSDLPCPRDCYSFLGEGEAARFMAKKITNTAINAKSMAEAVGSFWKAIDYWKLKPGTKAFERAVALNRAWRDMGKPRPDDLYAAARKCHKAISKFFFSDAGMIFMRHDSDIALRVMHRLAVLGIPAACYHDSFLVQRPHVNELERLMDVLYAAKFGFRPVIEPKPRLDSSPVLKRTA